MDLAQSLETILLNSPQSAMIMVAPPAWGKTRLLFSLFKGKFTHFIFVSPLKALALEFEEKCREEKLLTHYPKKRVELREKKKNFWGKEKGVFILIPEVLKGSELKVERKSTLIIFDEFHLFYYWGDTFRPKMNEVLLEFGRLEVPILGLTATLSSNHLEIFKREFSINYRSLWLLNLGNQKLKKEPKKVHLFGLIGKKGLNRRMWWEIKRGRKKKERTLVFCQYRYEVDLMVRAAKRKRFLALGCKGGEVKEFVENLKKYPEVEVIFSTLSLGHGVNLPEIHKVFINYEVGNIDFWTQMVGRGGRRGEEFEFFGMDIPKISWEKRLVLKLYALVANQILKFLNILGSK